MTKRSKRTKQSTQPKRTGTPRFNTLLTMDFSLRSATLTGKIAELYMIVICLCYPLFLLDAKVMGVSFKVLLFYILTMCLFVSFFALAVEKHFSFRRLHGRIAKEPEARVSALCERLLVLTGIVNFIMIPVKIAQGKADYEQNFLVAGLVLAFYLMTNRFTFYKYYVNLLLISGAVVFSGMMIHTIGTTEFMMPIKLLMADKQTAVSYIFLISSLSAVKYCIEDKSENDSLYLLLSGIGYFLLFTNGSRMGILLGSVIFPAIPLLFGTRVRIVKRTVTVAFLYFFLLSNMSLIANYTTLLKVETTYQLMNSIYLDLCMAIAGVCFFTYWDKLSEGAEESDMELPEFKAVLQFLCKAGAILFALFFLCGGYLQSVAQGEFVKNICLFVQELQNEIGQGQNVLAESYAEFGSAGVLVVLTLFLLFCDRVVRSGAWKEAGKNGGMQSLKAVFMIFAVQFLFMPINAVVTPIYAVCCGYLWNEARGNQMKYKDKIGNTGMETGRKDERSIVIK